MCCYCCSVAKLCLILCDSMDCSMPSLLVPQHLPEFAQIRVHWVSDAICFILCHPLLFLPSVFPGIKIFSFFSHQIFSHQSLLFTLGGQSIGASAAVSVLPMNIQDWFPLGLTGLISLQRDYSHESSPAPQFKSIISSVLSLLYGLTSVHNYWKNHSFDYMDLCQQSDVYAF